MGRLHLDCERAAVKGEVVFYDEQRKALMASRLIDFIEPPGCCGGSIIYPERYKLYNDDKQGVMSIKKMKGLMPAFEIVDLVTQEKLGQVKKKRRFLKERIEVELSDGMFFVDGKVMKRQFQLLNDQKQTLINIGEQDQRQSMFCQLTFDDTKLTQNEAAALFAAIESVYFAVN